MSSPWNRRSVLASLVALNCLWFAGCEPPPPAQPPVGTPLTTLESEIETELREDWEDAAQGGDAESQYNIAVCYLMGDGVKRNKVEGMKWLILAAKKLPAAERLRERVELSMNLKELGEARRGAESFAPKKVEKRKRKSDSP
ncbi:MAG: hypothetical protein AB1705_01880 [Verrucomicrobiota bacterium]